MTMPAQLARIDKLQTCLADVSNTVTLLVLEIRKLRRQIADRDGQIAELQAQLAAAGSR